MDLFGVLYHLRTQPCTSFYNFRLLILLHLACVTPCNASLCRVKLPAWHDGQELQSLYGVTMQSFLHGRKQGLTVSGRKLSGHLKVYHWNTQIHTQNTHETMLGVRREAPNAPDFSPRSCLWHNDYICVWLGVYCSMGWKLILLFLMVLKWCHVIPCFSSVLQIIRFEMKNTLWG